MKLGALGSGGTVGRGARGGFGFAEAVVIAVNVKALTNAAATKNLKLKLFLMACPFVKKLKNEI